MLVESFNRTRWLDKLRPAGASQKADGPEGPMAPIVTFGILIVENLLTCHPCARGHVDLSVSFHGRSTICACHPCARAMQFSPFVLLCRIEKPCQIFPPIPTFSNYACHPCTGVFIKKACTCHPCTKCHATFLCAKRKVQLTPCGRENRHSCETLRSTFP